MFSSPSRVMRFLYLLRDNSLNVLVFVTVLLFVFQPFISLFLTLFILYFILCQFKDLPIHRFLRKWGYDAWFLQYYNPTILDTDTGRELFDNRALYRRDYILMGYKEFYTYAEELTHLHIRYKEMNTSEAFYENCYN